MSPLVVARQWLARLTLAYKLATIHKEAWIPLLALAVGYATTGPTPWIVLPATFAAHLWWAWKAQGAYRRNAEDTLIARFHYRWTLEAIANPDDTPQLVAVHLERATRTEARYYRRHQGRHTLNARRMTLTVRARHDQVGKNWAETWTERTKVRYGFQTTTDPRPSPQDANATVIEFGQERLATEVRAVVA